MSAMSLEFTNRRPSRLFGWNEVKQTIVEWQRRAQSRNELMSLNDRDLQDIGVSRCTSSLEASKPFWMA